MKAKKQISALALLSIVVLLTACTSTTPTATPTEVPTSSTTGAIGYKDGTYIGTGKYSFPGGSVDYSVSLDIADGKIAKASFVKFADSGNDFYNRAQGDAALGKIVGKSGKIVVDTVTGATGTSKAIQDAVDNALTQAQN
ncbi:MAG: FMN-binding protein [Candidatus Gracilibacteria bacterium]|nr:FMN-binding protein [Candidatus Gracilibacteria bacterium]